MTSIKNQQYFNQLISESHCPESIRSAVDLAQKRVNIAIKNGSLVVDQNPQKIQFLQKQFTQLQLIRQKKQKLRHQLNEFPQQAMHDSEQYKKLKRQLLQLRKQENDLQKQHEQRIKRQNIEKAKRWREQQKNIQQRKKKAEQNQKQKHQYFGQRNRKDEDDMKNFSKLEKQKIIQKRIRQIQDRQNERKKILREGKVYLQSHSTPKYLEIQQKLRQQQNERRFEQELTKKQRKIQMRLDAEALKAHQRQFMQRVKQRQLQLSRSRQKSQQSRSSNQKFNILYNRNEQKLREELQKLKRRRKFQQKINQIPIEIDQTKKTMIDIAKDKSKNPFKYNFLSQKALNQFQIYGQFKQFAMNANGRQMGKQYLKQLRNQPKKEGISKSSSLHSIQNTVHERPMYKDYLQDLKSQRKIQSQDQFQSVINNNKNKQHIRDILARKSQDYEAQALRKLSDMKKSQNFKHLIKREKQADQSYMKAIKAKIACLEAQS